MKHLVSFILFFWLLSLSYSQSTCERMFESIAIDDGVIVSSEIAGSATLSSPDIPVISKFDLNGNLIWRIQDNISGYYNLGSITLYNFSDGYIYAKLIILDSHQNSSPNNKFWKIDASTGNIIWQTKIYQSDRDSTSELFVYDSNNLLFYTGKRNNNGGSIDGFEVYFFNRLDGKSELVYEVFKGLKSIKMVKDSKGNIYHSYIKRETEDVESDYVTSIRKINGLNFNNVIWERNYTNSANASLEEISSLYITKLDEIYAFSTKDNINLFKISSIDGKEVWSINNIGSSKRITHLLFDRGLLYLSLAHKYVGSVNTSFKIVKINLETAEQEWSSNNLHMTVIGAPTSSSGSNEAIYSFDLDCEGDIYATGYYGSSNYAPGAWGIMKINGSDGSKINDITITKDSQFIDSKSVGLSAHIIKETPVFLGNLQNNSDTNTLAFVTTNTSLTSASQNVIDLCSVLSIEDYQTNTDLIQVHPNPASSYLIIKSSDQLMNIESISLYNVFGAKIKTWDSDVFNISIKDIVSGVYLLEINTRETKYTKKIIKN